MPIPDTPDVPEHLQPLLPYISRVAQEKGIRPELLLAMILKESSGNAGAINPRSGARGLTQLMPKTAKELGVTDILDPQQNIEAGARYLQKMIGRFGSEDRALGAYNAGPSNVPKVGLPHFAETQKYVPTIKGWSQDLVEKLEPPIPYHGLEPKTSGHAPTLWDAVKDLFSSEKLPEVSHPHLTRGVVPAVVPGNVDLMKQPRVKNDDGSISTVDSMGIEDGDLEAVIPKVMPWGTHFDNPNDAIDAFLTHGRHLGKFRTPDEGIDFAQSLHEDYENGKYDSRHQHPIQGTGLSRKRH